MLLTLNFDFDYTYDTSNFFNTAQKRETLELAAAIIGSQLGDSLNAINPSGANSWSAIFPRPDNGATVEVDNPSIAADTLLVYVGARNLGTSVGNGGFGGYRASGTTSWQNNVNYRGETGETSGTDFGPWGGQLTFNTATDFHFGETVEGLDNDESDFLSVAIHELSHLLGFGLAGSFTSHVSGGRFNGPEAVAEFDGSGNVPLSSSGSHIAGSTTDEGRESAMDPGLARGERKLLTQLDWAVLADMGWEYNTSLNRDWGDAPNSSYPTKASSNGARHVLGSGLELGVTADPESDGHSGSGDGDDDDGFNDDDGVVFNSALQAGETITIDVTATAAGRLDAWIDFNGDGDWSDSGEQIFDTRSLSAGENRLTITVPSGANQGDTYARFRLSSAGGLNFTGNAPDGEVEDYLVTIVGAIAAVDDSYSSEGDLNVTANDLPAGDVKILKFEQPSEGTVTDNFDGTLNFDEGSGFSGSTSFDYTIAFEQDKVDGSSTDAGDEFGHAVALSENFAIVGVPEEDNTNGNNAGAAYLFERTGDRQWTQIKKFTAPDGVANDRFAFSVDIDENTVVIGSRMSDVEATNDGAAYIFRKNQGGTDNWGLVKKIIGSENSSKDQFGHSVAISGNTIVVGARLDDGSGTNSGSIYIFEKNLGGSENWGEQVRLKSSRSSFGDQFGYSVAIDGNNIVVGARKDDPSGTDSGSVFMYNRDTGGSENWGQLGWFEAPDGIRNDWFGSAVAIDGNFAIVGKPIRTGRRRPGKAYAFAKDGPDWSFENSFSAPTSSDEDQFGSAVAVSGNTAVVGSQLNDAVRQNAGIVAVHTRGTGGAGNWGLDYELYQDDWAQGDYFGASVAIYGDWIAAGSPFDDDEGSKSGSVSFQEYVTTHTGTVDIVTSSGGSGGSGGNHDEGAGGSSGSSSGSGGNSNLEGDDGDEQQQDGFVDLGGPISESSGEGSSCCCDQCLAGVTRHTKSDSGFKLADGEMNELLTSAIRFETVDSLFQFGEGLFR